jgi:beta-N-acetylhexosaminidase
MKKRVWVRILCLVGVFFLLSLSVFPTTAQTTGNEIQSQAMEKARTLLSTMSAQQKVGQLFLVSMNGVDISPDSHIYELIADRFIGGVVLSAENDNFSIASDDPTAILAETAKLTRGLQEISLSRSLPLTTTETTLSTNIPLLIGISQEGDGYSTDQILSGVTPLPDLMAIGATWNPDLSYQVGEVLGQELSALGFNLLLGPVLDVLEPTNIEGFNDLGTRTFGGNPYWVSRLGQAYIQGIHAGSLGRLAVIAKHFPGHGASDRLPEDEVVTIRKTLEQLVAYELVPFFAVTGYAPSQDAVTDGLLSAHIRYQGFQGNIRPATRPVSFDPDAMNQLLEIPALSTWRTNGGLMVSDNLGSDAMRNFYDLTGQVFDLPRRVALNSFLAGNDLLYVSDFSSADQSDSEAALATLNHRQVVKRR